MHASKSEATFHPAAHDPSPLGAHLEDVTHASVDVTHYRHAAHDPDVRAAHVHAERAAPVPDSRTDATVPRGLPA